MSAKLFLLIFLFIDIIYSIIIYILTENKIKQPLPLEVSDIFDKERYEKFIQYKNDNKKMAIIENIIGFVLNIVIILSPFFCFIERVSNNNQYLITIYSFLIVYIVTFIFSLPVSYYDTFIIEEKYGFNKKDLKEFIKDELISIISMIVLGCLLYLFVVFVANNLSIWTNNFQLGIINSCFICLFITIVLVLFVFLGQRFSYFMLRKQYKFSPLEDGNLKNKIMELQKGIKKPINKIFVYNESKKSTSKNAFLLKMFFHKEFGIADNFINENEIDELYAVLSHEIGHLKHKKNILNYIFYLKFVFLFVCVCFIIANPKIIFVLNNWINHSFGISVNNYFVISLVYMTFLKPIMFLITIFENYRSRKEEIEADNEAVKNGYGNELIKTFKDLSNDELINVNPDSIVEFLEYDHPGMYHRIVSIQNNIKSINL